jgi:agmatinase
MPVSPFDNALALRQMSEGFRELGMRRAAAAAAPPGTIPKLVSLGGDHSIALPALRALKELHGSPVAVLHFDAHLDTWHPAKYPSAWTADDPSASASSDATTAPQSFFTHGSFLWLAAREGLIRNGSVHAGVRTRLSGVSDEDLADDAAQGWHRIPADDIDDVGVGGVVDRIVGWLGRDVPVYLSVDIDVVDPGLCPGTGTPEPGGWTSRELIRVLRGVEALNVVGADVVEVSPSYDDAGESTALVAAQVVYEIVTSMVKRGAGGPKEAAGDGTRDEL